MRVYEIIAAGAAEGYFAQMLAKMVQRRRIVRFCKFKGIACAQVPIICNNYKHDLQKVCTLHQMGYVDAIIIAGMGAWSEEEKDYFTEMTVNNKVKSINLDELNGRYLLD